MKPKLKLIETISSTLIAIQTSQKFKNQEWESNHKKYLDKICYDHLPRGSGFDSGTTLNLLKSSPDKLVFRTSFHHMNDQGVYDGWTEHTVTVTPSFLGCKIKISGRDRRQIKQTISQAFDAALNCENL